MEKKTWWQNEVKRLLIGAFVLIEHKTFQGALFVSYVWVHQVENKIPSVKNQTCSLVYIFVSLAMDL